MLESILEQAQNIAETNSPDEAARFLAPYRKEACHSISNSPENLIDLIQITTAQMQFLIQAKHTDKAVGIAEWFLHVFHHIQEDDAQASQHIIRCYRESFSLFFMKYASALCAEEKFEPMQQMVRTSLDLTQSLPMAIAAMLRLYAPLRSRDSIEDEPASSWLLKRYAEALAILDFSGLHDTPFREALDNYQYAIRCPDKFDEAKNEIDRIFSEHSDDIALKILYILFSNS